MHGAGGRECCWAGIKHSFTAWFVTTGDVRVGSGCCKPTGTGVAACPPTPAAPGLGRISHGSAVPGGQRTPSMGRRQLRFSHGLCSDSWPSTVPDGLGTASPPPSPLATFWWPRTLFVPGVLAAPWALGCAAGRNRPLAALLCPRPPAPVNPPLVARASALREAAAAARGAPAAPRLPSAPSCSQRAPALMSRWPRPRRGERGLKRKAEGEKKSPFLGGAVNRAAFVRPCPPAPAGWREQGELIRQLGSRARGRARGACETPSLLLAEPSSSSSFPPRPHPSVSPLDPRWGLCPHWPPW